MERGARRGADAGIRCSRGGAQRPSAATWTPLSRQPTTASKVWVAVKSTSSPRLGRYAAAGARPADRAGDEGARRRALELEKHDRRAASVVVARGNVGAAPAGAHVASRGMGESPAAGSAPSDAPPQASARGFRRARRVATPRRLGARLAGREGGPRAYSNWISPRPPPAPWKVSTHTRTRVTPAAAMAWRAQVPVGEMPEKTPCAVPARRPAAKTSMR